MIEEEEIETGVSSLASDFLKNEAYAAFFEIVKSPILLILLWVEHDFFLIAAILILGGFILMEEVKRCWFSGYHGR